MAKVIANSQIGPELFRLEVKEEKAAREAQPGQFCHFSVRKKESWDPLLRRPFSIYSADEDRSILTFVYQVRGRGTKIMTTFRPGDTIDFLGPLGSGFTTDISRQKVVLLGGGLGIIPLYFLTSQLVKENELYLFLGAQNSEQIQVLSADFKNLDFNLKLASEDGLTGFAGTAVELLQKFLSSEEIDIDWLVSCGPDPMLEKIQKIMAAQNIAGEFSLEERMACGTGVCLSCVCSTSKGNKRVCHEGPVFSSQEVIFSNG